MIKMLLGLLTLCLYIFYSFWLCVGALRAY